MEENFNLSTLIKKIYQDLKRNHAKAFGWGVMCQWGGVF